MHQRKRRMLCRGLFLSLAVLPTAVVLACVISRPFTHSRAKFERQMHASIGAPVRLAKVKTPMPGEQVFQGFKLLAETGESALVTAHVVHRRSERNLVRVTAGNVHVASGGQLELADLLERSFRNADASQLLITAENVVIATGGGEYAIARLTLRTEVKETIARALIEFYPADTLEAEPVRVTVRYEKPGAMAHWSLQTAGHRVPCAMLEPLFALAASLPEGVNFAGDITAIRNPRGSESVAIGRLENVPLGRLFDRHPDHTLSTTATIDIQRAKLREKNLEELAAEIHAGPGEMSPSLGVALAGLLAFEATGPATGAASIDFDRLTARLHLTSSGLTIGAAAPGGGVVFKNGQSIFLAPRSTIPLAALVELFASAEEEALPLTPRTRWLTQLLPQ